ncbi:MAG: aspartyl protease family protein [Pyrobaculum sp.]
MKGRVREGRVVLKRSEQKAHAEAFDETPCVVEGRCAVAFILLGVYLGESVKRGGYCIWRGLLVRQLESRGGEADAIWATCGGWLYNFIVMNSRVMCGVRARLSDAGGRRVVEVEALVDTGAMLSVIPHRLAEDLALEVTGKVPVMTAGGRVELERTRVWIDLEDRGDVVPAVISDVIDKVLIGVTTLEVLGLQVDPVTGKLKEWTILLYDLLTL